MKKYRLTSEHRAQLPVWAEKWKRIIMSTEAMSKHDKDKCRAAVNGLYEAANLPRPKHIIFVPSPFVLAFAGGFAAGIWHLSKNMPLAQDATWEATWEATEIATEIATQIATQAVTEIATRYATSDATQAVTEIATLNDTLNATWTTTVTATSDATQAAIEIATSAATTCAAYEAAREVTWSATWDATWDAIFGAILPERATWVATEIAIARNSEDAAENIAADTTWYPNLSSTMRSLALQLVGDKADFLLQCAERHSDMLNGGNQWGQYVSFLSFFRHVAGLKLDYSKWDHYEVLATLSGPRIMHPEFCMISDKPELLTTDSQNRPHNDKGPFCRWRDGTALYAIHGIYVPQWLVEHPENITVTAIESENNAEVKRIMTEHYGMSKYVRDAKFEVIDTSLDSLGHSRRLLCRRDVFVVELTNSTEDADGSHRMYHVLCHPELRPLHADGTLGEPQKLTALNAVASTYGMRGEEYVLEIET